MVSKKVVLRFPNRLVDQPIVYKLVKEYDLEVNILKALITSNEEGILALELRGDNNNYKEGLAYLKRIRVRVEPLGKDIKRNELRCTHCGACIPICPTEALQMDPVTKEVRFNSTECIACELCIPACPPSAMELHY